MSLNSNSSRNQQQQQHHPHHRNSHNNTRPPRPPPIGEQVTSRVPADKGTAQRVGLYEVVKTLGEGSFGKVKLATHRVTKQQVALKIISRKKLISRDMIGRVGSLPVSCSWGGGLLGEVREKNADVLMVCRNARSSICSCCGIRISSNCKRWLLISTNGEDADV